jgi:hypothetical protein
MAIFASKKLISPVLPDKILFWQRQIRVFGLAGVWKVR